MNIWQIERRLIALEQEVGKIKKKIAQLKEDYQKEHGGGVEE